MPSRFCQGCCPDRNIAQDRLQYSCEFPHPQTPHSIPENPGYPSNKDDPTVFPVRKDTAKADPSRDKADKTPPAQ